MQRTTPRLAVAGLVLTALLAACSPVAGPGPTPSSPTGGTVPEREPEVAETPAPPTAADVRATGTPVPSGALTLVVRADLETGTVTVEPQPDGSVAATVPVWARTTPPALAASVAAPEGTAFEPQVDGSVVLRDAGGAFVGGLAPVTATSEDDARLRATFDVVAPDLLTVSVSPGLPGGTFDAPASARVWFGTAVLESAEWGEREGGRSLAVDPTPWARAGGLAAQDGTWAAVVAQEPEADSTTMRDQFLCHAVGAPDKDTWNLEPWRPDAGSLATLAARCNPE
ncbi:DUF2599 domain-containing protein [Cellulomonas cellasea]|uniref:DUF2599 domain-containing protein n=1 Tax=Cellulomonas cellasea TaxID=43670 RepID=A0A7W4UJR3_9CELL|nr:DUF2599 domain-containing protein [Cellulomonas cellasea]MBB2925431.1 hypothetical protein [Cellulomonas cellasea]